MTDEVPWDVNDAKDLKQYELAITGNAFQFMLDAIANNSVDQNTIALYRRVILHAKIYARMSPDHKALLVTELQNNSTDMIGMCGDGANDCKALKTADVGLSLSEAEASIAAPFTSKIPNISPIIKLLREGRTSIVTCFQVFKFMALYSMIQFSTVIILYNIASNLGNWQYLFIDLFIIVPMSLTMSRTGAYQKLDKSMPIGKLISVPVLLSVITQILIKLAELILIFYVLTRQSWFVPLDPYNDKNVLCYENTTLFLLSLTQYIAVVISFSVGKPFRKPMWTNISLMVCIVIFGTIVYLIIFIPPTFIVDIMELMIIPMEFRLIILGFSAANLLVSYMTEKFQI